VYLVVGGIMRFRRSMPPGSYLLEVIVGDRLAKTGAHARQTVDFELVQ